ncbi:MAG: hypothetical protein ACRDOM_10545 [Nocardioides sp.]
MLDRAQEGDLPVEVLVEGHWVAGRVLAVDGHGVVLSNDELGYAVIKLTSITAVRVIDPDATHSSGARSSEPMPLPRGDSDGESAPTSGGPVPTA